MKKLFVFLLAFSYNFIGAQIVENPVKWKWEAKKISTNEYELIFKATIGEGWHLYSAHIDPNVGPYPTAFLFEDSPRFKAKGEIQEKKPHTEYDPNFEAELSFFSNKAKYWQRVIVEPGDDFTIKGEIEWMVCNDEMCMPPEYKEFSFDIAGFEGAIETKMESVESPDVQEIKKEETKKEEKKEEESGIIQNPVTWEWNAEKISDTEYKLNYTATIEEGWHLYSAHIDPTVGPYPTAFLYDTIPSFSFEGKVGEDEPHTEFDPNFDAELSFFSKTAHFWQNVKVKAGEDFTIKGEIEWMVCNDEMCMPPEYKEFTFDIGNPKGSGEIAQIDGNNKSETKANKSFLSIFLLGFAGGLAAILMPCIFPMIPLTVSFFTKQSKTKSEGIRKALFYGISIIVIYVGLGLLVTVIFGPETLNEMSTDPWVNLVFFILFVIFAISFFGAFEITLPSSWVNKSDEASNKGGMLGIFFMAFTLSLVSFSCTGPIVGGLLVDAAVSGNYLGPAIGMFGFSLALAIPFTLFAIFPGWLNSLPKSGGWLNTVKVCLGFLELGFAFKFLSTADMQWELHLIEREMFIAIWVGICFLLVLYLLGVFMMPLDSKTERVSVPRLMFAMVFTIMGFYLLPGIWGAPVELISGFPPPEYYSESPKGAFNTAIISAGEGQAKEAGFTYGEKCPHGLNCFNDFDEGLRYAKKVNKPILIDFTGVGCVNCRKMEEKVWSKPEIHSLISEDYVLVSLYVDARTKLPKEEQYVSEDTGKKIRTVGNKWSEFQQVHYKANAQPYYVIIGHDSMEPLVDVRAFDLDVPAYAKWLRSGVDAFKAK